MKTPRGLLPLTLFSPIWSKDLQLASAISIKAFFAIFVGSMIKIVLDSNKNVITNDNVTYNSQFGMSHLWSFFFNLKLRLKG